MFRKLHLACCRPRTDFVRWCRHEEDSLFLLKKAYTLSRNFERLSQSTSGMILREGRKPVQGVQGQSRGLGRRRVCTKTEVLRRSACFLIIEIRMMIIRSTRRALGKHVALPVHLPRPKEPKSGNSTLNNQQPIWQRGTPEGGFNPKMGNGIEHRNYIQNITFSRESNWIWFDKGESVEAH